MLRHHRIVHAEGRRRRGGGGSGRGRIGGGES